MGQIRDNFAESEYEKVSVKFQDGIWGKAKDESSYKRTEKGSSYISIDGKDGII